MSVAKTNIRPPNTLINPGKIPLTADILSTFPGCENIPREEAEEIVASLEMLSVLLLEFVMEQKKESL